VHTLGIKCPNRVFYTSLVDLQLFVLNRGWKLDPLQMMIFVYVCSTCSVVELKTRFETWIKRYVVNGENLFHLSYLITLTTYPWSQWAPYVQFKYFMFDWSIYILFVLNRGWKRDSPQMMIFVCLIEMQRIWTKNEIWDLKWNKWCINVSHVLLNNYFGAGHWAYMCFPMAPNTEITYFMCDWSIYSLFVVNTGWKRESLQIMIFVNVYTTSSIVELKTRYET
jgi:hypothetical protein